jgi:hypothetical protein
VMLKLVFNGHVVEVVVQHAGIEEFEVSGQ